MPNIEEDRYHQGAGQESNQWTYLADCDDRLAVHETSTEQDYIQIIRLFGVPDFEKSGSVVDLTRRPRVHVATASPQYLSEKIFCDLVSSSTSKGPDFYKETQASAQNIASTVWARRDGAPLDCHGVSAPPVCRDVELALVVRHRQRWTHKGYSRGELLRSLSLAPGEDLTLEFFSWDRRKIEQERNLESLQESAESLAVTSRTSSEIVSNIQFKLGVGGQADVGGSLALKDLEIPIDVGGNAGGNFTSELTTSLTSTLQRLNEATITASNSIKNSRKMRIVETSEIGSEDKSIRKIKNENRCHTVNFDYFEVLEHFKIASVPVEVEFVALVPLPGIESVTEGKRLTKNWILCNEYLLQRVLLDSLFQRGFEAARLLCAVDEFRKLAQAASLSAPAARPDGGEADAGKPAGPTEQDLLSEQLRLLVDAIAAAAGRLLAIAFGPSDWEDVYSFSPDRVDSAHKKAGKVATRFYVQDVFPGLFDRIDELKANRDLPGNQLLQQLNIFLAQVRATGLLGVVVRPVKWTAFPLLFFPYDDEGLVGAIDVATQQANSLEPAASASVAASTASTSSGGSAEQVAEAAPPDPVDERFGWRSVAEAQVELDRLTCHIESNWDYYLSALLTQRGPRAWGDILKECPQVRPLVDARLMTIHEGHAVFPLRLGEQRRRGIAGLQRELKEMAGPHGPETADIAVPTDGTTLETRLGQCSACEPFIEKHRTEDLALKRAEVRQAAAASRQAEAEARRRELRLEAATPILDTFESADQPALVVRVDQSTS